MNAYDISEGREKEKLPVFICLHSFHLIISIWCGNGNIYTILYSPSSCFVNVFFCIFCFYAPQSLFCTIFSSNFTAEMIATAVFIPFQFIVVSIYSPNSTFYNIIHRMQCMRNVDVNWRCNNINARPKVFVWFGVHSIAWQLHRINHWKSC